MVRDVEESHRFHAACAAIQAAQTAGDIASASAWRRPALAWLTEEIEAWEIRLEQGRVREADLRRMLTIWRHERALASVRGMDEIARLPDEERSNGLHTGKVWRSSSGIIDSAGPEARRDRARRRPWPARDDPRVAALLLLDAHPADREPLVEWRARLGFGERTGMRTLARAAAWMSEQR